MYGYLGGDGLGVVHHFDEDELAVAVVFFVEVENGVGRSAGTGKGVEDDGVFVAAYLQDSFDERDGFRRDKIIYLAFLL